MESFGSTAGDKSGDGFLLGRRVGGEVVLAVITEPNLSSSGRQRNNNTAPAESNKSRVPPVACGSGRCFAFAFAI